jgi:hypothetical protein
LVLKFDEVALFSQLGGIKETNRFTELGEADELSAIDSTRVSQDTASVDHSNRLVGRK